jgi:hypothetical protein
MTKKETLKWQRPAWECVLGYTFIA